MVGTWIPSKWYSHSSELFYEFVQLASHFTVTVASNSP